MKLFLTAAGIKNPAMHRRLVEMLPKPIDECDALMISTGSFGHRNGPAGSLRFYRGEGSTPMVDLGWRSLGVLELSALPALPREHWLAWVEAADIILVNGGDALFLAHFMKDCGFADVVRAYPEKVYLGLSGGSMVMTPNIGVDFMSWQPPSGSDVALGLVDFAIFPHMDHPDLPENTKADAYRWAETMTVPCYLLEDECGISIVDGVVVVVGDGRWELVQPTTR